MDLGSNASIGFLVGYIYASMADVGNFILANCRYCQVIGEDRVAFIYAVDLQRFFSSVHPFFHFNCGGICGLAELAGFRSDEGIVVCSYAGDLWFECFF